MAQREPILIRSMLIHSKGFRLWPEKSEKLPPPVAPNTNRLVPFLFLHIYFMLEYYRQY
ncbi:MAG: hypothetical protein HY537_04515 [Deltaproteobacteria bacterium]|nr:hypothetical protein [Deltaproteobacteria bacterium]